MGDAKPKQRRSINWRRPLLVIVLSIGAVILIVAFALTSMLIEELQTPPETSDYLEDMPLTVDERIYLDLAQYCTMTVGYGMESCLDWVDTVMAEHLDAAVDCLSQFDVETPEDRLHFGDCLGTFGVEPVFW